VLASLDLFIVNVALPQIGRDFHLQGGSLADLSWVLNGYAIVYAAFWFCSAGSRSAIAATVPSWSGWRCSSGLRRRARGDEPRAADRVSGPTGRRSGAFDADLAGSDPRDVSPPERRHGAVRTWTAVGGLFGHARPVVGGLLVARSWRWVFLVNVPVGLLALAVGWRRPAAR